MHIGIIGAGVVGVTTAHALASRGHRVTVIERLDAAGLETSRGNAGQRSYGYVYPWASPAMIKKALPWLIKPRGPLKMRIPPTPWTLRFLAATWRFANAPGVFEANKRAMLRLGAYSRQCFLELEEHRGLAFDGSHGGLIDLASDPATAESLKATMGLLEEMAIDHQWLTPEALAEVEPGMGGDAPLVGALRLPGDGTGDCQRFTQALADECRRLDVTFRYATEVGEIVRARGVVQALRLAPTGVDAADGGEDLSVDALVIAAGCASPGLAEAVGVRLPIYPVKGYSLTAPLLDPARAPRSTVIDDRYKVVATRLGNRLRATGFVELAEFDRWIPESRLATIREAVSSRFPGAADLERAESWTGFRPMTPDGPPIIGRARLDNLYFNTGHGTFGWTLSAGSAQLIAQLVDDDSLALDVAAFHPRRFGQ
ncbi:MULTISPECIES: D-amino acid dehydrogenase [unclassified Modicisalibacter]|uniref:D-amino acid dehydrogenase n=1 Tax=unclassified Modicisalibacter TaxID=2679913 RepID=UPI001CCEFBE3|nr:MULTISPECIES: D-amino acid dehydrogenase [unclassified Modicisalibacter]MBZ9557937.1 D-amino acid dehydrogenase [Modicisalibacter sp. R2A 31.J]MBZ9573395.1 D-amino acid dehydrogenase [Modicisalibacter sp. MOD 31.J]